MLLVLYHFFFIRSQTVVPIETLTTDKVKTELTVMAALHG